MGVNKEGLEEVIRFRGKDVKLKKVQKHVRRKPSVVGTIFINMFIILALILAILLVTGTI